MKFIGIVLITALAIDAEVVINHEVQKSQIRLIGKRKSKDSSKDGPKDRMKTTVGKCVVSVGKQMHECVEALNDKNRGDKDDCESMRRSFKDWWTAFKDIHSSELVFDEDGDDSGEDGVHRSRFSKKNKHRKGDSGGGKNDEMRGITECIKTTIGTFIQCVSEQKRNQDSHTQQYLRAGDQDANIQQKTRDQRKEVTHSIEEWKDNAKRRHRNDTATNQPTTEPTLHNSTVSV